MNNELYHHGILGMKWGIRRYQSYDVAPRGSGKRGKEIGEAKDGKERRGLSNKQKKALKIGAAVVGGALVAYGAYRLIKSKQSVSVGKKVVEKAIENVGKTNVKTASITKVEIPRTNVKTTSITKVEIPRANVKTTSVPRTGATKANQIKLKFGDGNSNFKPSTFKPDTFKPDTFEPDTFKPETFEPDTFKPYSIDDDFLRNNDELLKRFRKALG